MSYPSSDELFPKHTMVDDQILPLWEVQAWVPKAGSLAYLCPQPMQIITRQRYPFSILLKESPVRMVFTIVDGTKIPQSCSTEQLSRVRHFSSNQNIKVCQVGIMGRTQEPAIKLHDTLVNLAAHLLRFEGPTL